MQNTNTSIISFIHEKKMISFDPVEFFDLQDEASFYEGYRQALKQFAETAFWLTVQRKRKNDAEQELEVYSARLYHQLKIEGEYAHKYKGAKPTEDALKNAISEDKHHQDLVANLNSCTEIVDHLWSLQKTVEKKFSVMADLSSHYRNAQRTENFLASQTALHTSRANVDGFGQ